MDNKLPVLLPERCAAATSKGRYSVSPVIMSDIRFSSSLIMPAFRRWWSDLGHSLPNLDAASARTDRKAAGLPGPAEILSRAQRSGMVGPDFRASAALLHAGVRRGGDCGINQGLGQDAQRRLDSG